MNNILNNHLDMNMKSHSVYKAFTLRTLSAILISSTFLFGCNKEAPSESIKEKQERVCAEEAKPALDDPQSLEVLSSETFKANDGTPRLKLSYTYKNRMGGRQRGETICGFTTEGGTELKQSDMYNQMNELTRKAREAGMLK